MTLDDWLATQGPNAAAKLALSAGVSIPVVYRARQRRATLESAEKIRRATGDAVDLGHMTAARELPITAPTTRRRNRAKRASA